MVLRVPVRRGDRVVEEPREGAVPVAVVDPVKGCEVDVLANKAFEVGQEIRTHRAVDEFLDEESCKAAGGDADEWRVPHMMQQGFEAQEGDETGEGEEGDRSGVKVDAAAYEARSRRRVLAGAVAAAAAAWTGSRNQPGHDPRAGLGERDVDSAGHPHSPTAAILLAFEVVAGADADAAGEVDLDLVRRDLDRVPADVAGARGRAADLEATKDELGCSQVGEQDDCTPRERDAQAFPQAREARNRDHRQAGEVEVRDSGGEDGARYCTWSRCSLASLPVGLSRTRPRSVGVTSLRDGEEACDRRSEEDSDEGCPERAGSHVCREAEHVERISHRSTTTRGCGNKFLQNGSMTQAARAYHVRLHRDGAWRGKQLKLAGYPVEQLEVRFLSDSSITPLCVLEICLGEKRQIRNCTYTKKVRSPSERE